MTGQQRTIAWIAGLVVFLALLFVLRTVLLPFVVGMAVAYFLDPVCDRMEHWGCSRTVATVIVTALFFVLVVLAFALVGPLLYAQIVEFVAKLPGLLDVIEAKAAPLITELTARIEVGKGGEFREAVMKSIGQAAEIGGAVLGQVLSGLGAVVSVISLIVITPVVSFFLLRDWDRIVKRIDGWSPREHAETIREQARLVDQTLAGFVRGQMLVCLIVGSYYATALTVVGLEFGIVVGLVTGLMLFIPYVGMLTGFAVSMGLAFAQFDSAQSILLVAVVFAVGQPLEGVFLTPKLVGDRVGLHPVWILFALLAGASLFGFVGVLLAVPTAAVIGVGVRFAIGRYLAGPLYNGAGPGGKGDDGSP
ncbi:MAG: AI-2E family transporter [Alphaproteobacteria bacterium]|jgi:predicted PurR-regulated permease PerM|nr:AI-2E family transporter [Alphaproteobacteria bacterium]